MSHEFAARCRFTLLMVCALCASPGWSADPPTPQAADERTRLEVQYALQTEVVTDPELDPVVFTEIVPFTAEETAVRLPSDQDLD
jgi:hypothetical protein